MVRLTYSPSGKPRLALCSDATWKASKTAGKDWQKLDFDDSSWTPAKALGAYGMTAPWTNGGAPAGNPRFTVPEGFRVEMAAEEPRPEGRLLAGQHDLRRQGPAARLAGKRADPALHRPRQGRRPAERPAVLLAGQELPGHVLGRRRPAAGRRRPQGRRPLPLPRHEGQGRDRRGDAAVRYARSSCRLRRLAAWASTARTPSCTGRTARLYVVNGNHSWAKVDKLAAILR